MLLSVPPSAEAALLVYTALRVSWTAAPSQPWFSVTLVSVTGALLCSQSHPQLRPWVGTTAAGTKPSQAITLFHGLLAFPCLLSALASFCPSAWSVAWVSIEVSVSMFLWTVNWPPIQRFTHTHLPIIKVAYTCWISSCNGGDLSPHMSWMSWTYIHPGGTLAPILIIIVNHCMPDTLTLGESMMVTHALIASITIAIQCSTWLLSTHDNTSPHTQFNESQAAITFTLLFWVVSTIGVALLGMLPHTALPWHQYAHDNTRMCEANIIADSSTDTGIQAPHQQTLSQPMTNTCERRHTQQGTYPSPSDGRIAHATDPTSLTSNTKDTNTNTIECVGMGASQPISAPWWARLVWLLLMMTAGVAAGVAAYWVLVVFVPGHLHAPDLEIITQSSGPKLTVWCTEGLETAAATAFATADTTSAATAGATLQWLGGWLGQGLLAQRLHVLLYWGVMLVLSLIGQVYLVRGDQQGQGKGWQLPLIIVRKGYHALAVVLFVPVLDQDPNMLVVSLSIAWGVLLVLELCRVQRVPVLGAAVHRYMSGFVDERDSHGCVYFTHLALMIGLAAPVWLSTAVTSHSLKHACHPSSEFSSGAQGRLSITHGEDRIGAGGIDSMTDLATATRNGSYSSCEHDLVLVGWWLVALSGMISIGVGDAVASVIGSTCGRHRLHVHTKKTWEGTCSSALAMLMCTAWAMHGQTPAWQLPGMFLLDVSVHVVFSAVLEALTLQIDNLVVPVWHMTWMMMCVAACNR